jgi:hypothetical protein
MLDAVGRQPSLGQQSDALLRYPASLAAAA